MSFYNIIDRNSAIKPNAKLTQIKSICIFCNLINDLLVGPLIAIFPKIGAIILLREKCMITIIETNTTLLVKIKGSLKLCSFSIIDNRIPDIINNDYSDIN